MGTLAPGFRVGDPMLGKYKIGSLETGTMLLRQLIATLGCVVQRHQNGKPSLPHGGDAGMGEQTGWNARHQTLRVTAEEGANLLEGSELPWSKSVCLVTTKIIETQGKERIPSWCL